MFLAQFSKGVLDPRSPPYLSCLWEILKEPRVFPLPHQGHLNSQGHLLLEVQRKNNAINLWKRAADLE